MQKNSYLYGITLALIGAICLSTSGLMLRLVDSATGWQLLFYRGLTLTIVLTLILAIYYRRTFFTRCRAIGLRGLIAGVALGAGSCAYIYAILLTSVANVMFILALSPSLVALAGWLFIGERFSRAGLVAIVFSIGGIGLMLVDQIALGRWQGNLVACLILLSFIVYLLIVRSSKHIDMLPCMIVGGITTTTIAYIFADNLSISTHDLTIACSMGGVQFLLGFGCLTLATKYILATEVALMSLAEPILAPIWVWLLLSETPSTSTLIGGCIVLISVIGYCITEIHTERAAKRAKLSALT